MDSDPRFEVEDADIKETMRKIAAVIDGAIKLGTERKLGFALQIFEFDGPAFFWISNADRGDMVKALQEFIARERPQ